MAAPTTVVVTNRRRNCVCKVVIRWSRPIASRAGSCPHQPGDGAGKALWRVEDRRPFHRLKTRCQCIPASVSPKCCRKRKRPTNRRWHLQKRVAPDRAIRTLLGQRAAAPVAPGLSPLAYESTAWPRVSAAQPTMLLANRSWTLLNTGERGLTRHVRPVSEENSG